LFINVDFVVKKCIVKAQAEDWAHKNSLTPPFCYWSSYTKPGKRAVIHLCARFIDFASFCDFDILFWNCFDSVEYFVFHFLTLHGMYFPLYSICYLFIGMTGDNRKWNAKFKVSFMVNNKITGISCEDLVKYHVSWGNDWLSRVKTYISNRIVW